MSTKASRRTKKTVPKTILNLTPARSTEEEEEEEVEGEEEQNKATDRGATVDDNEDAILLESSDNYRRLECCAMMCWLCPRLFSPFMLLQV